MDLRKNARLTPQCRELLVQWIFSGRTKFQAVAWLGISVKTVDNWLRR